MSSQSLIYETGDGAYVELIQWELQMMHVKRLAPYLTMLSAK